MSNPSIPAHPALATFGDEARMGGSSHSHPLNLLILDGDGVSDELTNATEKVLKELSTSLGIHFILERKAVGLKALKQSGTTFPADVLDAARKADGIILGPVSHNEYPPVAEGGVNPSGELRRLLDLYANVRPARSLSGISPRFGKPIDLVIVRENTEGFYADRSMFMGPGEFMPTPDVALALRKVTRTGSTRIAECGFSIARRRRKKVTVVHKANVLRVSDGLFLKCVREVAEQYSDIEYEEKLIDSMAALLVRDPTPFDVVLTTNMFGDILSDQAVEISGSIGLGGSLNFGSGHALAQAQHGSAPDLADLDTVNPYSLISSTAMLLEWIGRRRSDDLLLRTASTLGRVLESTIANPEWRTVDLGGPLGTSAFASRVALNVRHALQADATPPVQDGIDLRSREGL